MYLQVVSYSYRDVNSPPIREHITQDFINKGGSNRSTKTDFTMVRWWLYVLGN